MPKKLATWPTPTLVQERLTEWGRCLNVQRLQQRITVEDLCQRLGISQPTFRRMERGDATVNVGAYLTALLVLGMANDATPSLRIDLWNQAAGKRVRPTRQEQGTGVDDDYF